MLIVGGVVDGRLGRKRSWGSGRPSVYSKLHFHDLSFLHFLLMFYKKKFLILRVKGGGRLPLDPVPHPLDPSLKGI